MRNLPVRILVLGVPLIALFGFLAYFFPPIHSRLSPRVDALRTRIIYALNPPEEAVFIPQGQVAAIVQETISALTPTLVGTSTPSPTATATVVGPTKTPLPSPTPTLTATPLPVSIMLPGVKYEDQHNRWNYCGPANLSMALTFWGWDGNRDVVGKVIKPSDKDKNVMPYEMLNFIQDDTTGLGGELRSGGDVDLIRRMIANGFPVLTEKGYLERDYNGKLGWMGHYQFVTGYDDAQGVLIVQDTYNDGPNHAIKYADFVDGWRDFNYVFLVTYPISRQADVLELLGQWADPNWANQHALETAQAETLSLSGLQQFFAWYNVGTSYVNLQQYYDAAIAYDNAFTLYADLPDDAARPYRMLWYQTGPYFAYFYSGRYQDVVNLADTTLNDTISEPVLEESLYWRGLAKESLGDTVGAVEDYRKSLEVHPDFAPTVYRLELMGITP